MRERGGSGERRGRDDARNIRSVDPSTRKPTATRERASRSEEKRTVVSSVVRGAPDLSAPGAPRVLLAERPER